MNVYLRILQILFCCVFHFTFIWAAASGCCCNLEWSWLWRHAVSLLNSCGKSPQFFVLYSTSSDSPLHFFTLSWYWAFAIVVLLLFTNLTGFFIVEIFFALWIYDYQEFQKVYFSKCVLLEMDHQCTKSRKIYEQIISHSEIFTFTTEYDFNMSNATDRY